MDGPGVDIPQLPEFQDRIRRMIELSERGDEGIMKAGASEAIRTIKERTAQGTDMDNQPFPAYSEGYAKKTGKFIPDLEQSGTMMRALRSQAVDGLTGRVYVEGTKHGKINSFNLAEVHHRGLISGRPKGGSFHMPRRSFMGLTLQEAQAILKDIGDKFYRAFLKIWRGQ